MRTELHWIEGPWNGRLAIMPRPRGGDWLEDEILSWKSSGIDVVVSLLTTDEEFELNIAEEEKWSRVHGIEFRSFPITDREVPDSFDAFSDEILKLSDYLAQGKKIAVHCRQGVGRAGLLACCLLVASGIDPDEAINRVSVARGLPVPETPEQRRWVVRFGKSLVSGVST